MAIYSLLLLIVLIILILIVLLIFEVVFVVFVLYLSILKIDIKVAVNDIFVIILLLLLILVAVGEIADEVRIHLLLSKHSLLRRRILLILFVAGERVFLHFSIACLL